MRSKRVAVTGIGVFCSIGKNVEEFTQSLREGRTGFGPITLFDRRKPIYHFWAITPEATNRCLTYGT